MANPQIEIQIQAASKPQYEFWESTARSVSFVGGVGSGKSWSGCIKVFQQPPSTGMVLAPTYPMLRDATLRTFIELAERAHILADFNRSEMRAELVNGTTVLFRSTEHPDRLRGPNLGWFWMDEAALSKREAYLIMLGRLREAPGRAWLTTTPRGKNWLYREFVPARPGYHLIKAPSNSNPFLPADFVESLQGVYKGLFAAQEVGGEFVDDQTDALIVGDWLDQCGAAGAKPWKRSGSVRTAVDLGGGNGGDNTVILTRDDNGVLGLEHSNRWPFRVAASRVAMHRQQYGTTPPRITWDVVGIGKGFGEGYLEPMGIKGAVPYAAGASGGTRYANLRAAAAWALRLRLDPDQAGVNGQKQSPFAIKPEWLALVRDEICGLRWTIDNERKIALQPKEEYAAELGHSPDFADVGIQAFAFLH